MTTGAVAGGADRMQPAECLVGVGAAGVREFGGRARCRAMHHGGQVATQEVGLERVAGEGEGSSICVIQV